MGHRSSVKCHTDHPLLGRVNINLSPRATRFTMRWRDGYPHLTAPATASQESILRIIDTMAPRVLAKRPSVPLFEPGSRLEFDGLAVEFRLSGREPHCVSAIPSRPVSRVDIGAALDLSAPATAKSISTVLRRLAGVFAAEILLPRARSLAASLGVEPAGWKISRGQRTLGQCSSERVISLSSVLVFLPLHLRDYVVAHELAHLTEMNHSPRFHALCNAYCGGRERELERDLKAFNWPVMR